MLLPRKPIIIILISIGLLVGGFILLLRGCLSQYDERSAIVPALYFDKDDKEILFAIVKFDRATSYSRKGNFISKSVSTSYYIQTNDPVTGEKIGDKKIKHHSDIKNYPVQLLGASASQAWVFMGELMAFDPYTLTTTADLTMLEEKNPALKNKLPGERRFYSYNPADQSIVLVATDGVRWELNTTTLVATSLSEEESAGKMENRLDALTRQNQNKMDTLVEKKLRQPSRMLAAKQISMDEHQRIMTEFRKEQAALNRERDSLSKQSSKAKKWEQAAGDERRKLESLRGKTGLSFSQVKVNMDTMNGKWYGLYTKQELDKVWDRVHSHTAHAETARRQLFATTFAPDKSEDLVFDKKQALPASNSLFFLNGGFLLNKNTGTPIHRNNCFFVVHKNSIGGEGKIQLTLIDTAGRMVLTFDSQLREWTDWILTETHLILFGRDHQELSGNEVNVFLSLNLSDGKVARYDYFTDKTE
jgi:hypothetical protein